MSGNDALNAHAARLGSCGTLLVAALLLALPGPLFCADPTPQPTEPPAQKQSAEEPDDFEKLIQDLKPSQTESREKVGEKIQRIADRMRAVHRRLLAAKTDLETQAVEHQVVKDIDDLLDLVRQHQNSPRSSSSQNQQQRQQQRQRNQVRTQNQRPQSQTGQQQRQQQQQPKPSTQSGQNPARQGNKSEAQKLREALQFQDWGHLPPAVREELLQSFKEEFLPRYRKLLEIYYRSLAEKKTKETR